MMEIEGANRNEEKQASGRKYLQQEESAAFFRGASVKKEKKFEGFSRRGHNPAHQKGYKRRRRSHHSSGMTLATNPRGSKGKRRF